MRLHYFARSSHWIKTDGRVRSNAVLSAEQFLCDAIYRSNVDVD